MAGLTLLTGMFFQHNSAKPYYYGISAMPQKVYCLFPNANFVPNSGQPEFFLCVGDPPP